MGQFQRNNFNSFSVATKTPQYTALAINSTELEGQNATDRSLCTYMYYIIVQLQCILTPD